MEWWYGVFGALVLGLVLGGIRALLRRGITAGGARALDAAHPLLDRAEVRIDTWGRERFARGLVLGADPATAAPLVAAAMPRRGTTATSPTSWRFRRGREFHVELVATGDGTLLRAAHYEVENGVSPYYPADYAGILRRVRRAARRAGLSVADAEVRHESSPADGAFSIARAVGDAEPGR